MNLIYTKLSVRFSLNFRLHADHLLCHKYVTFSYSPHLLDNFMPPFPLANDARNNVRCFYDVRLPSLITATPSLDREVITTKLSQSLITRYSVALWGQMGFVCRGSAAKTMFSYKIWPRCSTICRAIQYPASWLIISALLHSAKIHLSDASTFLHKHVEFRRGHG